MIDRIDNTNYYNDYTAATKKKVNTKDTKDFSLNLQEKPFLHADGNATKEELGVELQLHEKAKDSQEYLRTNTMKKEQTLSTSNGITLDQMKQVIHSFVQLVKETWNLIWNDAPAKDEPKAPINEQTTEDFFDSKLTQQNNAYTATGDTKDDLQVQDVLKSKDINQLTNMITQNGKLKLAKNSQLLTTYDRQGKIVQLGGSEKERILKGDKNLMKL